MNTMREHIDMIQACVNDTERTSIALLKQVGAHAQAALDILNRAECTTYSGIYYHSTPVGKRLIDDPGHTTV